MKHEHSHHDEHDSHGHRFFGHKRKGGRGKGPGRIFDSDDLRYVILYMIQDQTRHGYEIIKMIEELLSGAHAPSPGMVYPTLTLLEEMGFAESKKDGTRKVFSITQDGKQELEQHKNKTTAILQRMQDMGQRHANERPPQLMRAMENLKMSLQMHHGKWTPELLSQATETLDAAARKIESLEL